MPLEGYQGKPAANGALLISQADGTRGWSGMVEANVAVAAAPNVLTVAETRAVLCNTGATAMNYHTLPGAAAGLEYTFIVADADGIRVVAASGDTIRIGANVSPAAGYIESTTIGSIVRLFALNATEWFGQATGTWTVST
jgi:hypothetical protein